MAVILNGCASPELSGEKDVRFGDEKTGAVSQVELQEDLQRFSSQLIERVSQVFDDLEDTADPRTYQAGMRHYLRFVSSVVDIETAPYPEVNLLDMIAFVRLNREVIESYWIPKVYGAKGRQLLAVLERSESDLVKIADKVSTKEQQRYLYDLVQSWRDENPDQIYVERVRLTEFAKKAGQLEKERAEEVGGLLASVQGAVSSADQALLLANRAMALAKIMPFLLRIQARIGTHEIFSDSIGRFDSSRIPDILAITTRMDSIMERAGPLMEEFRRHFPRDDVVLLQKLSTTERITGNMLELLNRAERLSDSPGKGVQVARARFDGLIWTITKALVLVGAAWAAFWWGGYYLAKRPYVRAIERAERQRAESGEKPSSGAAA